jgi:hypothetical protein
VHCFVLPNNSLGIWLNAKAFSLAEMQRHSAVSKTMAKRWKRFA